MLRDEWGSTGSSCRTGTARTAPLPAANAGLDLEMPGPPQWFGEKLAEAVRAGEVAETALDDKVRRVLTLLERTGRLDDEVAREEECIDDPVDRRVARRAAAESFVLLANERAVLPLGSEVKTLAVIGPNADATIIQGGGSARVTPHPPVSPLAGLRARFGSNEATVEHERGCYSFKRTPGARRARARASRLRVEYFAGRERAGEAGARRGVGRAASSPTSVRSVTACPSRVLDACHRHRRRSGIGGMDVLARAGRPRSFVDRRRGAGRQLESRAVAAMRSWASAAPKWRAPSHSMPASRTPSKSSSSRRAASADSQIGCRPPAPADLMDRAVALARRADAVVCVVGTDSDWETEGNDRESMALPAPQDELVRAVAAANPNVVVVVNAASPVDMPWAGDVGAIVQCWFPGEEWGNALADVLSGDVAPSGKLPTTIPASARGHARVHELPRRTGRRCATARACSSGTAGTTRGDIAPRFCFGHGLSYTTFEIGEVLWTREAGEWGITLTTRVTNTGSRRGAEVVQCYVRDVEASVARPVQELKAFAKVWLDPGEGREVSLHARRARVRVLGRRLRATGPSKPGEFEFRVGTSSRDIRRRFVMSLP